MFTDSSNQVTSNLGMDDNILCISLQKEMNMSIFNNAYLISYVNKYNNNRGHGTCIPS